LRVLAFDADVAAALDETADERIVTDLALRHEDEVFGEQRAERDDVKIGRMVADQERGFPVLEPEALGQNRGSGREEAQGEPGGSVFEPASRFSIEKGNRHEGERRVEGESAVDLHAAHTQADAGERLFEAPLDQQETE